MNRVLLVLTLLLFPAIHSQASEPGSESLRAGVMYLIAHKSEIEINRGNFGIFSLSAEDRVEVSFYEELHGTEKFSDSLIYGAEEQRRIGHNLFAYDRKTVELEKIQEQYPGFFSADKELQCQNAFFPYTVCLIEK